MTLAHAIGGRSDLPIPTSILLTSAAAVLLITFLGLSVLWPRPRLQDGPRDRARSLRLPLQPILGTIGVLALALVIGQAAPPLFGAERVPLRSTMAPVTVWVLFWLVVPFAGAVVGNWYTDLNPWRALADISRLGMRERAGLKERMGVWPAAFTLIGFAWLELVYPSSGDPVALGVAATVYTVWLLGWVAAAGKETALTVFDAFTPYNRLISAISPLGRDHDELVWRGWLRALTVVPEWPGLWFFAVAMIGTVSYDGVSGALWFRRVTGGLGDTIAGRSFLLLAVVNLVGLAYFLACAAAARSAGRIWETRVVAQRFAHTLVPIGLAYAASHYFTLILFEGQQVFAAISDPFGLGWDLFGTADRRVQFFLTSSTTIWLLQVGFIVIGHLVGVVLAHDRALRDFGPDAVRSQYAMLGLMIALTSLGLLILSG